jgi:polysaccharide export outer membrane protein
MITAFLAGVFSLALLLSQSASAQEGYKIRQGDILRIEVLEDPSLNRSTLVAPDGRITLPLAGSIRAGGRTIEAVQKQLITNLEPSFATSPTVFVAIERLAEQRQYSQSAAPSPVDDSISVFIMGEAAKPGRHTVAPGTTLLQVFAEMGGFSKFAATKRIQLRRKDPASGNEMIYALNYKSIEAGKSPNGSMQIVNGDVIVIPQRRLFE